MSSTATKVISIILSILLTVLAIIVCSIAINDYYDEIKQLQTQQKTDCTILNIIPVRSSLDVIFQYTYNNSTKKVIDLIDGSIEIDLKNKILLIGINGTIDCWHFPDSDRIFLAEQ